MTTARKTIDALLARSNELGADPRNTNYAGGNTSAKGSDRKSKRLNSSHGEQSRMPSSA